MQIIQMKITGGTNFMYLAGCETGDAVVIDPSGNVDKIIASANYKQWHIRLILNTHGHYDHTAGNEALKKLTGAKIIMHCFDAENPLETESCISSGTEIKVGSMNLKLIHTPGHTPGGICIYCEGNLFTGDTLFVGDSGRTDLRGGNRRNLGESIRKLMVFDDHTVVWPGHDYGPMPHSTLGWEKIHNVNAKEYRFYRGD
jgi:hydroxyacylglutathione hydrolase